MRAEPISRTIGKSNEHSITQAWVQASPCYVLGSPTASLNFLRGCTDSRIVRQCWCTDWRRLGKAGTNKMDSPIRQETLTLCVQMDNRTDVDTCDGFHSSDDCRCMMTEFFKTCELPYVEPFTCAAIQLRKPERKRGPLANRPGIQPRWRAEAAFGNHVFVLNDKTVSEVRIVCAGDFQNIICKGVADILNRRKPLEDVQQEIMTLFRLIPAKTCRAEIDAHLSWALANKGQWPYAEARLFRPVWKKDGQFADD
jgi:hypothetical protein